MDLNNIKQLDTVVDRLNAAGPSGVSPPHCWFCGRIGVWFRTSENPGGGGCDCKDAQDARAGKRPAPRVVERDGHMLIILDPEIMAREHNQRRKRYVPPVANAEAGVSANTANKSTPVSAVETLPANAPDRKAYMRDLMRRKRERDRAAKGETQG